MFGHSHDGKPCTGHHGGGGGGGHSHAGLENLTEEQRAYLMKMFQERMQLLRAQQGHGHDAGSELGHSHSGDHHHGGDQNHGGDGRNEPSEGDLMIPQQGVVFEYPEAQVLREASGLIRGYGHEPPPPVKGWGDLAPPMPQALATPGSINRPPHLKSPPVRDNYWQLNAPWGRRLRIVKDRGGLVQALGIVAYWLYGNWSTWSVILLPYYSEGLISFSTVCIYTAVSILCITSFIRASTLSPGSLRKSEVPQDDWTQCNTCQYMRPPRTHHCRRCGHCVREMDHHCPWINNCVGEENKFAFMQLVAYAFLLSAVSLCLHLKYFLWLDICKSCNPESLIQIYQVPIVGVCVGLASVMLMGSANLYITQHISLIHNTPTLEWMRLQQEMIMLGKSENIFPAQTTSTYQAYRNMCGGGLMLLWMFPCRWRRDLPFSKKMSA